MSSPDALRDLSLLIRSRYGLILLDSDEEARVDSLLRHVSDRHNVPYFKWTAATGLRRDGQTSAVYGTEAAAKALGHIEHAGRPAVYHLRGFGSFLSDAGLRARLKEAIRALPGHDGVIVLSGANMEIPADVRRLAALVKLPDATIAEYKSLLRHLLRDLSRRMRVRLELSSGDLTRLLHNLKGLTLFEAEKILTRIVIEDGRLAADDIRKVMDAKKSVVEKEGVLEYYPVEESFDDVADLKGLKTWLAKRREIVVNPERARSFGLTFPKGVLLLGVQGCGKSLCAKAVAMAWNLPLLKLDPSSLYNKYIGETEKNVRRAMAAAERMAPVILWIDEIEKAFSGAGSSDDGGVSTRVLGSFLTWMQERRADVFVIATANNISILPPEMLRKGRFDEIFFVDLPPAEARRAIFEIHLKKRRRDPARFKIDELVAASDGFSGAEIEQAVVASLYTAFSLKRTLDTALILSELRGTRPLSETMREKVDALRNWARERAVSAQ